MKDPNVVTVTLSSHTNVGKTTLLRTLLRRDVGVVQDRSHVTDVSEAYVWLEKDGRVLRLWDTPGFGDSAKLLRRLQQQQDKPLRWLFAQTFDRFKDRPLWCSQQAIKNIREDADVVLYLVNAAEKPEDSGYLPWELKLLDFLGKPAIVVLNNTGVQRSRMQGEEDERTWRLFLASYPVVREVRTLDAFGRCWVSEGSLLEVVHQHLPQENQDACTRLIRAWKDENMGVFRRAMAIVGKQLADSVLDSEAVPKENFMQKAVNHAIRVVKRETNPDIAATHQRMIERLARRTATTCNDLIALHGLDGHSTRELGALTEGRFSTPERVNESIWTAMGGAIGGAGIGLAADLHAGGLSFGAGTLVGILGGGAGAYFLARGFNLTKNAEDKLFWSREHFFEQVKLALMCYLAVAHFGRGRGAWADNELPQIWEREAGRVAEEHRGELEKLWKAGQVKNPDRSQLEEKAARMCEAAGQELLLALYPESQTFLAK